MHPFMDLHSDTDQLFMIKIVQRKNIDIDIDIAIFTLDISISISKALQDIDPSLINKCGRATHVVACQIRSVDRV